MAYSLKLLVTGPFSVQNAKLRMPSVSWSPASCPEHEELRIIRLEFRVRSCLHCAG